MGADGLPDRRHRRPATFFLYDSYGRLRTWNDKTGKSQDYDFDAFGNLTCITDFDGLHPATYRNFAVSQANNQLTTWSVTTIGET